MRNDCTNDTIGKTSKLLENVKHYPIPADYCRYDTRKETTGHRYLCRTICRAYKGSASESGTLRRGTRRAERDTADDAVWLGGWQLHTHCRTATGLGDRAGIKERPKSLTGKIKNPTCRNAPLAFIPICRKIHSIPFAYGRALVFFTKGGVL